MKLAGLIISILLIVGFSILLVFLIKDFIIKLKALIDSRKEKKNKIENKDENEKDIN